MTVLKVEDLQVSYGHLQVLFGVDIAVAEGEIVALLGTNGAGKSTLLRAVMGMVPVRAGRVQFAGADITDLGPEATTVRGLTLVEGGRAMFPSLTVDENLRLGGYPDLRRSAAEVERRVEECLDLFPDLRPLRARKAGSLSGGEQQMVAVGRALVAQPKLLMIDELSLGLAPVVLGVLVGVVRRLAAAGTAVLLVEQSLNVAMSVAARAYYLEKGEVRFSGEPAALTERGDLVRSVFFGVGSVS